MSGQRGLVSQNLFQKEPFIYIFNAVNDDDDENKILLKL